MPQDPNFNNQPPQLFAHVRSDAEQRREAAIAEFRDLLRCQRASPCARALTVAVPVAVLAVTCACSDAERRARGLLLGAVAVAVEAIEYERTGRGAFSSVDRFFASAAYAAVFLDRWQRNALSGVTRVMLGPATFWAGEIVANYVLLLAFGRNTAWSYVGQNCNVGLYHGAVDLSMFWAWWPAALALEVCYAPVVAPVAAALAPYADRAALAVLAAALAAAARGAIVPRFPPLSRKWPRGQKGIEGIAMVDYRGPGPWPSALVDFEADGAIWWRLKFNFPKGELEPAFWHGHTKVC